MLSLGLRRSDVLRQLCQALPSHDVWGQDFCGQDFWSQDLWSQDLWSQDL